MEQKNINNPESVEIDKKVANLCVPKQALDLVKIFICINVAYIFFLHFLNPVSRQSYYDFVMPVCEALQDIDGVKISVVELQKVSPDRIAFVTNVSTFIFLSGCVLFVFIVRYLAAFSALRLQLVQLQNSREWSKTETKYTTRITVLATLIFFAGASYSFAKQHHYGVSTFLYNVPVDDIPLLGRAIGIPLSVVALAYLLGVLISLFAKQKDAENV